MPFVVAAWALPVFAGPLDAPRPEDMVPFRCLERPLGTTNDVELGDRKETSSPPGPPVYPEHLLSGLVPLATDDALKKAGKRKGIVVFPSIASLSTGGQPVTADCENRATDQYDFAYGCVEARACDVFVSIEGHPVTLGSRPQIASKYAPVDSVKEAVGLVALYDSDVFLPMTQGELADWAEAAEGFHAVEPAVPWLEVEERAQGYLVRVPRRTHCGCDRDIVRRTYWVSHDGRGCAVDEKPVTLAVALPPAKANDPCAAP